jgi:hypothetical protein
MGPSLKFGVHSIRSSYYPFSYGTWGYHRVQKILPLHWILNAESFQSRYSLIFYFFKIQFNISFASTRRSSKCSFSGHTSVKLYGFLCYPSVLHASPVLRPLFAEPNNIWWGVQVCLLYKCLRSFLRSSSFFAAPNIFLSFCSHAFSYFAFLWRWVTKFLSCMT